MKQGTKIESSNITYAVVLRGCMLIGLLTIILSGLLYFVDVRTHIDVKTAAAHWHEPVSSFWYDIRGERVSDYSWFLLHLTYTDSLVMLGISLLALSPLIGILLMIPGTEKRIRIFLVVLAVEFIFSILRPFL